MNCFAAYARVSTQEQAHGLSLESQIERCTAYGHEQGWQMFSEYVDPGFSGTTDQRPQFQQMLQDALTGKFQYIVCLSYDRLFRNMEHAVVYKSLFKREGVQVISVMEPVDNSSPLAMIHEGIIDLFAAFYSRQLSGKVKEGMRKAAQKGGFPSKPPIGYKKVNSEVVVSDDGPVIAHAFTEFATGQYTLHTWADQAYELGIRRTVSGGKLSVSQWSSIFNKKFYMGRVEWAGMEAEGNHQALVDPATFERVQQVLLENNGGKRPKKVRFYLLRGLCYSLDADSRMTGAASKVAGDQQYRYYRSVKPTPTGQRHYVSVDVLEENVGRALERVELDHAGLDQIAPKLDDSMRLALRVVPNLGLLYQKLDINQKRDLLRLAVKQYGLKIRGEHVVSIETKSPFVGG